VIYKIQRPLIYCSNRPECFLYNEDRSHKTHIDLGDLGELDIFFGERFKVYVEAEITKTPEGTKLTIQHEVEGLDW